MSVTATNGAITPGRTSGRTTGITAGRARRIAAASVATVVAATAAVTAGAVTPAAATTAAAEGSLVTEPGRSAATGLSTKVADGVASATFRVPRADASIYFAVGARATEDVTGYRGKVRVAEDGSLSESVVRVRNGVETSLGSFDLPDEAPAGSEVRVQTAVTGTLPVTVRMRAWVVGEDKPDWQIVSSDTSASRISTAGTQRVWAFLSSSASAKVTLPFTNFSSTQSDTAGGTGTTTSPSTTVAPRVRTKPSARNTGVPAGTTLKKHYGDLKITRAGTVIDRLDVHGFITVEAPNVTIRRSIVRGGKATYNRGVITNYGYDNLLVEDVDIRPAHETVWQDGVKGSDFTLDRVHVTGGVDSVKIHGAGPVRIKNSLLENTKYYAKDPNQGGGPTHNDGIQILDGTGIRIIGNTIRGQQNMAVLGAANRSHTKGLVIRNNWLDGGHCTVKLEEKNGYHIAAEVTGNKFGPNRAVSSCKINGTKGSAITSRANTMELTGQAVKVLWTAS